MAQSKKNVVTDPFKAYFDAIKGLDIHDATEHTLRGALENLLRAIVQGENSKVKVIHEPKKDKTGLGAPDFKLKLNEAILGYLENKPISENLDKILKSEQIVKYKKLSGNLILTNYLEWVWLKDGVVIKRETLCDTSTVGDPKARLNEDKADKTCELIVNFLSTPPEKIARAKPLALALATRCHALRDYLFEELERQEKEHKEGKLFGLYQVFKLDVFHELKLKEFADAFSQTLGYGLFLAKLNAGPDTLVTLENAKDFIPGNFELIRELVDFLDELKKPEYHGIKWLVEEILSIMNTLDLAAIHEDLAFTKRQGRLLKDTEEERLLFAKDPYVYFYEDFLKAYDKDTRKSRGVYYTPPPVVNFIIRAINDMLKGSFGIEQGLADRKRVTVLDFATGTGTFLIEVLQQIFETVPEGIRNQVIQEHVLKNLYGFEYLIAPYTIAHLKLSQFLHDKGYVMQPDERLQIYLTNTLEPIQPQANWLLPALSREVEQAQEIKEKPILIITGNPPYSGHSKNTGDWITGLIETYKQVNGGPLGEKNPKWLQNDYVKFIRFSQWKMEQIDEGIVGIITSHSFLDNPTFRGMRQSLMQTFNQIYVLDLHGNLEKKEAVPDGGKDENIFDIKEGVAISLLVKKEGLERRVYHADLWGSRKEKYSTLLESDSQSIKWKSLKPNSPHYLFIQQNETLRTEYEQGWKVSDVFTVNSVGIVTARDDLTIQFTQSEITCLIEDFAALPVEAAREKYNLGKDSRDWKVNLAQEDLKQSKLATKNIVPITYLPFDTRYTYYTGNSRGFHCMPRGDVMRHMLEKENVGIITTRLTKDDWSASATHQICGHKSGSRYDISYLFPLYEFDFPDEKKAKTNQLSLIPDLSSKESTSKRGRKENFKPDFREEMDKKYDKHYSPEEIMGYIYAVLHSPTYRSKYVEFLRIDFPRIPFVDDRKVFEKLSKLGWELMQVHLLKTIPKEPKVDVTKGGFVVEKPVYDPKNQRLYINKDQYFSPIPQAVWDFHIGGYQVLDKYLKSRKGRKLELDEIENIQHTVKALAFTIEQMNKIDQSWKP